MRVYVLIFNYAVDGESVINVRVFATKTAAQREFNFMREKELKYAEENSFIINYDEETSFEAYEEGYYSDNHTTIWMEEHELST